MLFLENARNLLKKDTVRCLRISDFNTTGLTGVGGKSTPWQNLVKNRGVSDKPSSATGSFGIGKDAAFACSQLRTVFYNTVNIDESSNCAFQGVLKLPSYKKGEDNYVGQGFFSAPSDDTKTNPVMESISLDPEYVRKGTGMDKYILGFDASMTEEELKKEIIVSSITNFLLAFWEDKLMVKYGDVIVDKGHLDELFELYNDDLDNLTKDYYQTLVSPDRVLKLKIFEDNDVEIFVKIMEGAGRRAAITRQSGMKVFNKDRIDGRIEFAAVVVLRGDEVNGYFKTLENPEHTNWALDRAKIKTEAQAKQRQIFDALKEALREMHQSQYSAETDADGVNEYLPMTYILGKKKQTEGLSNEVEVKKKAKKKKHKASPNVVVEENIVYEEDEQGNIIESTIDITIPTHEGSNTGGGDHSGDGDNDVSNPNGDNEVSLKENELGTFVSKRIIPNDTFKFVLLETDGQYKLKFWGKETVKEGFAEVLISGETESVPIGIRSASIDGVKTIVNKNLIKFDSLEKDEMHVMSFDFIRSGDWAIEVRIHESK